MQFDLLEMWHVMGPIPKAVGVILIVLNIFTLYMFFERNIIFARAKKRSVTVAPKLADFLKNGSYKEALALASKKENKSSHLARVTASGVQEFIDGRDSGLSTSDQIASAERGATRAATLYKHEMSRGFSVLATIATSSPFIGLFGTIFGIITAFRGMALTGSGGIGAVAAGIAEALVMTALGIGVAIVALWVYNMLNNRVEILDAEMNNTSSQIVDFFVKKTEAK